MWFPPQDDIQEAQQEDSDEEYFDPELVMVGDPALLAQQAAALLEPQVHDVTSSEGATESEDGDEEDPPPAPAKAGGARAVTLDNLRQMGRNPETPAQVNLSRVVNMDNIPHSAVEEALQDIDEQEEHREEKKQGNQDQEPRRSGRKRTRTKRFEDSQ